jgi:hypothetical protein
MEFDAAPKVNTFNTDYKKTGGNVAIFSENLKFDAGPKVNTVNENYKKSGGNVKVSLSLKCIIIHFEINTRSHIQCF